MNPMRGAGTVSTRTGGGATLISMETPADAMPGAVAAPAASIRPSSNALRETCIHYSLSYVTSDQIAIELECSNVPRPCCVDPRAASVGQRRIRGAAAHGQGIDQSEEYGVTASLLRLGNISRRGERPIST